MSGGTEGPAFSAARLLLFGTIDVDEEFGFVFPHEMPYFASCRVDYN